MTFAHFLYVPMVFAIGVFAGLMLGVRAARNAMDLERRRDEERLKARAEREARKAARAAADAAAGGGPAAVDGGAKAAGGGAKAADSRGPKAS